MEEPDFYNIVVTLNINKFYPLNMASPNAAAGSVHNTPRNSPTPSMHSEHASSHHTANRTPSPGVLSIQSDVEPELAFELRDVRENLTNLTQNVNAITDTMAELTRVVRESTSRDTVPQDTSPIAFNFRRQGRPDQFRGQDRGQNQGQANRLQGQADRNQGQMDHRQGQRNQQQDQNADRGHPNHRQGRDGYQGRRPFNPMYQNGNRFTRGYGDPDSSPDNHNLYRPPHMRNGDIQQGRYIPRTANSNTPNQASVYNQSNRGTDLPYAVDVAELTDFMQRRQIPNANNNQGQTNDGYRRTNTLLGPRAQTFNGKGWEIFINKFETRATLKGLSVSEKLEMLQACLEGEADEYVYQDLTPEVRQNYDLLVFMLEKEFREKKSPDEFARQLNTIQLRDQANLPEYATEIRRVVRKGYPGLDRENRHRLEVRHFIEGIRDYVVRMEVAKKEPRTMEEAEKYARVIFDVRRTFTNKDQTRLRRAGLSIPEEEDEEETEEFEDEDIPIRWVDKRNNFKSARPAGFQDRNKSNFTERKHLYPNSAAAELPKALRDYLDRHFEKKKVVCYNCQQPGHYSNNCPEKQTESTPREETLNDH